MGGIKEFIDYLQLILGFYEENSGPAMVELLEQLRSGLEEIKSCA
ncbi:MAG: hypothetical protein U9P49_03420 [Thermodesulfobacteriota bacterium]|nr:hypothetical protein [Thermodesulfobacteriota bacterium]